MARRRRPSIHHGVVVIDKPQGRTSHDVVQAVRRRLGERRIGHAGTLDPMATGVLVVMVGEATKLAPFLTADDKTYEAEITFGFSTDSLDADGAVTAEVALPDGWTPAPSALEEALAAERRRTEQIPPAVSAIKVDGRAAHARVRDGEQLELPARPIAVRRLVLTAVEGRRARLLVEAAKGFYVRSLARDLGAHLGVPATLTSLRRLRSGAFAIEASVPLDGDLAGALLPIATAATRAMAAVTLTAEGVARARCGGPMRPADFAATVPEPPSAWLDHDGNLVAIGRGPTSEAQVLRGFETTEHAWS